MKKLFYLLSAASLISAFAGCDKDSGPPPPIIYEPFQFVYSSVDGKRGTYEYKGIGLSPEIRIGFTAPIKIANAASRISLADHNKNPIAFNTNFENNDSVLVISPSASLDYLRRYTLKVSPELVSNKEVRLNSTLTLRLLTQLDSSVKFPLLGDDELLTLVQERTFKYFWDFAHPISGLARERNTSGDIVTSGGSGFGIMTIPVGIERKFISRQEGLDRMHKIVDFLLHKARTFKGAYPHWLNGSTGEVVPFSQKDNGADLVETSYLVQGLLTARQYFNGSTGEEETLRKSIDTIWRNVQWDWFRKENENVLYWHWSPEYGFEMNHPIKGWNECLITYVLAASSPTHTIPREVYDQGWASSGAMKNGKKYYGITLPLGPDYGGPLFFSHYSFLGLDPNRLKDAYADYFQQNQAHTGIHYEYAKQNPKRFYGYSDQVWGLTASDDPFVGYLAHQPANDNGVIAPTAAISSMPYKPQESMAALKFYYYILGDRIWKEYGFVDAFSLDEPWFANSFLAIDQGPIIIMIENHRTGLLWGLFMSNPEVQQGLIKLGFE